MEESCFRQETCSFYDVYQPILSILGYFFRGRIPVLWLLSHLYYDPTKRPYITLTLRLHPPPSNACQLPECDRVQPHQLQRTQTTLTQQNRANSSISAIKLQLTTITTIYSAD